MQIVVSICLDPWLVNMQNPKSVASMTKKSHLNFIYGKRVS